MSVLVYVEYDNVSLKGVIFNVVIVVKEIGGDIIVLVVGLGCVVVVDEVVKIDGVSKVLLVDNEVYGY